MVASENGEGKKYKNKINIPTKKGKMRPFHALPNSRMLCCWQQPLPIWFVAPANKSKVSRPIHASRVSLESTCGGVEWKESGRPSPKDRVTESVRGDDRLFYIKSNKSAANPFVRGWDVYLVSSAIDGTVHASYHFHFRLVGVPSSFHRKMVKNWERSSTLSTSREYSTKWKDSRKVSYCQCRYDAFICLWERGNRCGLEHNHLVCVVIRTTWKLFPVAIHRFSRAASHRPKRIERPNLVALGGEITTVCQLKKNEKCAKCANEGLLRIFRAHCQYLLLHTKFCFLLIAAT